jgi:glutaredoxin-related protein
MRILFYSQTCNFCLKLLEYIDKNKLAEYFKLICIDKSNNIPKNITIVPTVVDTTIQAPLEGKKAFEYVINQKYFNHPTNNIEYTKDGVPKPVIEEDNKANTTKSGSGFIYVDKDIEKKFNDKEDKQNFDQVFTNKQIPLAANSTHNNNTSHNSNTTHNSNNSTQQKIQQQQESDNRVNQLMAQRNIQDKKLQALIRLRDNR